MFPFVRRYDNFAYASDHDFIAGMQDRMARLDAMLQPPRADDERAIRFLLDRPFASPDAIARRTRAATEVITDENMLTEYRFGLRGVLIPQLF